MEISRLTRCYPSAMVISGGGAFLDELRIQKKGNGNFHTFFNPSLINLSLISSDHPSFVSASQGSHIQRVESHDWWLNNLSPTVRKVLEINVQLWLKSVTVELLIVVDYELKALDTISRSSCDFRVRSIKRHAGAVSGVHFEKIQNKRKQIY